VLRLIISLNKAPNEWKQLPTPSLPVGDRVKKVWDLGISLFLAHSLFISHASFALCCSVFSFVSAVKNNYAKMAWRFMNFNCYVCPGIPHFTEGARAWHFSLNLASPQDVEFLLLQPNSFAHLKWGK